jgi:hypothetical protein
MFSLLEIKKLVILILGALACVAIYFIVKGGTLSWLIGKPCTYGNIKMQNGETYYDKYYEFSVKCEEGNIVYLSK